MAAAAALLAVAGQASANGIGVTEVSTEGLGRANSGEVADTGASALFWNPAAIARGGRGATLGVHHRNDDTEFSNTSTTITRPIPPAGLTLPVGGRSPVDEVSQDFTAPHFAVAVPFGDRFAVGLSVHKPIRLKTDFGADSWARYDTIRSKIETTEIQTAAAIQATEWLDLGVGFTANYTDAYYDQASPNLNPTAPDGLQALAGDGWNYGFTLGAQAHLERVTLGVAYRSKVKHELDGSITLSGLQAPLDTANFTAEADTNFTTRSTVTVGARFALTDATTLNGQVVWSGWDVYDTIDVAFAGMTASIPQGFKNTTSVAVGVDHDLNTMWTIRGGVQFDPTPTHDDLREPGVFDSDRWVFAAGASARLQPALTLNGAVAYTRFDDAPLVDFDVFYAGTPAQTTVPTRGAFKGDAFTASMSLDWQF
ncbi:OmpP1/FadL family transporter [Phenylobacterium sp. J367]|uniref:OmpP1/FadL family transporter n=1 Tax=Phenylobacterium sp. J367 TaxID=2898435 RepID=UPI0021513B36|nr:outer membrane protein transport protein [Phenylobacterium sp. J367]MCR5878614.1 outer membrane protein transport protein [Phenylobacterium sp. J367]